MLLFWEPLSVEVPRHFEEMTMMMHRILLSGCFLAALSSATRADIDVDVGRGPVKVHVPASYDPAIPTALIVMLHGYTSSGNAIKAYFDIDSEA